MFRIAIRHVIPSTDPGLIEQNEKSARDRTSKGLKMNMITNPPLSPWDTMGERLLAATAIKIELPPSTYFKMLERKRVIEEHLERDGSPLKGLIQLFYQQGSVAIGATIKAKFRDDGFDIDIVVELKLPGVSPSEALDLVYVAMKGERGSRYHDCTERQTRCVTVHYTDGMHLDLTPSILIDAVDLRRSHIFHSKPEEPRSSDYSVLMNSFAFAAHYNGRCPPDRSFEKEYARRARSADPDILVALADAESMPAPPHSTEIGGKSAVTVALQLLKRNRIIRWRRREGRMPPSVMLSCLTLEVAEAGRSIGENLRVIATHILQRLEAAEHVGQRIFVENPCCPGDLFTDRWPETRDAQRLMIDDMRLFLAQLRVLLDERKSFKERTEVLEEMFGETVGRQVRDEFADEQGQLIRTAEHGVATTGSILAAPGLASARPSPKPNTFYGSRWPGNRNR